MGRVTDTMRSLAQKDQKALVAYVMAGYPDADFTISAVRGLVHGGADIIELGFPFSDPLADGSAIQEAAAISLEAGTTMSSYYGMVRRIREFTQIPLITMTYSNIAYNAGYEPWVANAVGHGIDGFILPDMPLEESGQYVDATRTHNADAIFLVSPNTDTGRAALIGHATRGFLYMVAVYGTTGTQHGVQDYAIQSLRRIKGIVGNTPVGIGFGISGSEDVQQYVQAGADAVIVGSAFLRIIKNSSRNTVQSKIGDFARTLKNATLL